MIFNVLNLSTAMSRLLFLRTLAIVMQLISVLVISVWFPSAINTQPLWLIIAAEIVFHSASCWRYYQSACSVWSVALQAIADIIFLTLLMAFSGGATNAFVSLLLMPIVIAAVSVPTKLLWLVSLSAVISYTALLLSLPQQHAHMDMSHHFIGMWVNFLLSVIVVTLVVGTMSKMITQRERAIAKQREEQLKSEQLIALGVASAQVTHQLATPLATLQLLFEEVRDLYPDEEVIVAMEPPLTTCRQQLHYFRQFATDIRERKVTEIPLNTLIKDLKLAVNLQYPQITFALITDPNIANHAINSDAMLVPALCNLVQNAVNANVKTGATRVECSLTVTNKRAQFQLRDFGMGIDGSGKRLGFSLVKSESGLGMALMLTSSSIERLGGSLSLYNHPQQGAVAFVNLPIVEE